MDESVDNEANTVNVYDSKRFRTNEIRFLTKHERSPNTQEMVIPDGVNIKESTSTSTSTSMNTRCLDDAGAIVEELTIRNYSSGDMDNTWRAFFPSSKQVEVQNDTVNVSRLEDKQHTFVSPSVTRSRMLSQSGFSKYFAKNTSKGKGVVISSRDQNHLKPGLVDCNSARDSSVREGSSLRGWLKSGRNKVDKSKSMCIFKQILDLVDSSHSRGEALLSLRPSCFKLTLLNKVLYMGSPNTVELEPDVLVGGSQGLKRRKHGENGNAFCRWPQFAVNSGVKDSGYGFNEENMSSGLHLSAASRMVSDFDVDALEEQWYASPEDSRCSTLASNVYSLGVLLFELLGSFESARSHATAMLNLRQRILPPSYLSENPREAGFCLWLLHPEPSSRPTTREILQSDLISGIQQSSIKQLSSTISQDDTDSDLMLHFLVSLKEQRQKRATKLREDIKCLESDISEIESRRADNNTLENHSMLTRNLNPSTVSSLSESRLINNISHLEHAYFSVRSTIENPDPDIIKEYGEHEVLRSRENNIVTKKTEADKKPLDRVDVFFNGLCKYARYSKFEVRGILRNGDFANSGNVICSLGFDRDEDYFATAGVSRKIKIYDFHALLNDSVDIHYPAVEMSNKSKLSSICWNNYIRNYLASTDYDGAVKIWDAGTGEAISHHIEHERRAWSVDFSRVDPIKFASGSDDCSVKLWSINEKKSLTTIKTVANVCCVQFSPYSTHLLSYGSADYRTYCYDLRNVSTPMCILSGHGRAISYVKFLDCGTLVSASTDNTLKLWDLNKTDFGCLSTNSCILTFKGHTNEKNFVGLSVADGYIACGSETNEVFAYYRSLPMPITSHKFGSIDPISGKETEHENNHFVSSVCWRQKSDTVLAANSSGCLKLLQMV